MGSQLEYGDYYKFIASAGIALIVGAVAIPWLFLREPFDLAVEASKIGLLTPDAQNIIHARQHLVAVIIGRLPIVSAVMASLGTVLTVIGLCFWYSRQSVRDRSEDLQAEKLSKELKAMSPDQIETRAKNDLENEDELEPAIALTQSPSAVSSVLAVEQALLSKISTCLGQSAKVMSNQRLGNVEYDAIVRAKDGKRIIVEIKYIRKGFNRGWFSETASGLASRMALYTKTFDESCTGLLLVVIATSNSPLSNKLAQMAEELRSSNPSRLDKIRVHSIYQSDIANMPCLELTKIVMGNIG